MLVKQRSGARALQILGIHAHCCPSRADSVRRHRGLVQAESIWGIWQNVGRARSDFGSNRKFDQLGPNRADVGQNPPTSAKFDQLRAGSYRIRPTLGGNRRITAKFARNRISVIVGPNRADALQTRPTSAKLGSETAKFGPSSNDVGPNSGKVGPISTKSRDGDYH